MDAKHETEKSKLEKDQHQGRRYWKPRIMIIQDEPMRTPNQMLEEKISRGVADKASSGLEVGLGIWGDTYPNY